MVDPTVRSINRLFFLSFKFGGIISARYSYYRYYQILIEIRDFNTLINIKPFLINLKRNKKCMKYFSKCQETMVTQQETD